VTLKTTDGVRLKGGQHVRLFYKGGRPIEDEVHHFGGNGWQLGIRGPYVDTLFHSRLNALKAYRDELASLLRGVDIDIADEQRQALEESK
jgi:hypothetical protein